jgi:3-(methylthio)propanoyl-CoA dehydrogenase
MSNYFLDNADLLFRFSHLGLEHVIELREAVIDGPAHFPADGTLLKETLSRYRCTAEQAGELAAEFLAPRARGVDRAGSSYRSGEVSYAPGIVEGLEAIRGAGLLGITLPRRFGGLNYPVTMLAMVIELISRADAALMTIFGLQEIAQTVNRFASEQIKQSYLPRFARGEVTASMALTEPEAGSDLGNVQLTATQAADGRWYLKGVKRFISNGCGQVALVLARSEPGTRDAGGLSLFLYEREEHMRIRRIEDKLGIRGSPTCELQFSDAPALLIGERRRGLTPYAISLMNGSRLAVAAQAVGIA